MEAALHLHALGQAGGGDLAGRPAVGAPRCAGGVPARARGGRRISPTRRPTQWDLCIDALLGIGAARSRRWPDGAMDRPHAGGAGAGDWRSTCRPAWTPTPAWLPADCVQASATLCLLTLKPGLFTADGRDCSARSGSMTCRCDASHAGRACTHARDWCTRQRSPPARHATHKGSYGDVAVVGGAPGMAGAALLAAMAALHAGAGRVFLCALDTQMPAGRPMHQPELMLRDCAPDRPRPA